MKPTEIQVGKTYTDGVRERRVVVIRGNGVFYTPSKQFPCLLTTFARWAKSEVKRETPKKLE